MLAFEGNFFQISVSRLAALVRVYDTLLNNRLQHWCEIEYFDTLLIPFTISEYIVSFKYIFPKNCDRKMIKKRFYGSFMEMEKVNRSGKLVSLNIEITDIIKDVLIRIHFMLYPGVLR